MRVGGPWVPKASWYSSDRRGKTPKSLTQETCPDRGWNPGPLRDRRACYHLALSGGPIEEKTLRKPDQGIEWSEWMRIWNDMKWGIEKWRELVRRNWPNGRTLRKTHSPSFPSLGLRHSSFSNSSFALPMSQLILQQFLCLTYVTAHSPTLLSLLLRHRIFTCVTWRAAHAIFVGIPYWVHYDKNKFTSCVVPGLSSGSFTLANRSYSHELRGNRRQYWRLNGEKL